MTWKPSNEPTGYDRARVAQVDPIDAAINELELPFLRLRKFTGILNALIMQIEDGGDSPEVNRLLLEALRAAVRHQVGDRRGKAALRAIDNFERAEAERWEQIKAGTLPPIELTSEEQLDDLMQKGYTLLQAGQRTAACDQWLEAWELVKRIITPEIQTTMDFDHTYRGMLQSVSNWCSDLEMELHNAGLRDPTYHEQRVCYVNEFLIQFPGESNDEGCYLQFRRAEGEALWELGRQAEAEAVYQALVEKLPDQAWGYIGWSDQYHWGRGRPVNYERAETILLQALNRPNLDDRANVLDRLVSLYKAWDQPEKGTRYAAELDEIRAREQTLHQVSFANGRLVSASSGPSTQHTSPAPKPKPTPQPKTRKRKKRRR